MTFLVRIRFFVYFDYNRNFYLQEINDAGTGGHWPDHLTLFQPGREDYPHLILLAPLKFFTFRHHWKYITKKIDDLYIKIRESRSRIF